MRQFMCVVSGIFLVIAAVHLTRMLFGWSMVVGGVMVPVWVSSMIVILAGFLSYYAFVLVQKK